MRARFAVALLACAVALSAFAQELLEPEKAFRIGARTLGRDAVEVSFAIADGYYLYRDKFRFAIAEGAGRLGVPEFPPGVRRRDEFFGEVETYRKEVRIRIPVEGAGEELKLRVTSQGCADIGVCYVPMESLVALRWTGATATGIGPAPAATEPEPRFSLSASDVDVAALFTQRSTLLVLMSFLGFGLLLAFTPCVLPMLPILSSIIAGEGRALGKARAAALSAAYVLGMAVAYAAAGIAAAFSGTLLAAALQNPWVLGGFATVFVLLALAMFDLFHLRLPGFLFDRLHAAHSRLPGGRLASVAAMGALSAVIVSPCVAAPLAGALLYISQTRDLWLGGGALFAMALGMGAPLIAVGVSEGALLPRAGAWMNTVKRFFGVLLLAVAIWIATPVLGSAASMFAWAALAIGAGVFLRALDPLPPTAGGGARLGKAAGLLLVLVGAALLVGLLAGGRDPLRPLAVFSAGALRDEGPRFQRVGSLAELERHLVSPGRPVMLEFYADWCVSCKEMEEFTFRDPRVRARLERMLLLQADVTANTAVDRELLRRFSLYGPPGIVFFDAAGREIAGLRVIGFQSAERFAETLDRVLAL